jgi:hypothetical protein
MPVNKKIGASLKSIVQTHDDFKALLDLEPS